MQATITYLLTEQAQRAQMVATGQPVARKQTLTEEIGNEWAQSPLLSISEDGVATADLARNWGITESGTLSGTHNYSVVHGVFDFVPASGLQALEAIRDSIESKCAEMRESYARACAARQKSESEQTERRKEGERLAAIRATEEAQREKEKADFIAAWVRTEYGDDILRAQFADGLACRKTILSMIAGRAFSEAGLPEEHPDSVVCRNGDCPCCDKEVECLPTEVYARWRELRNKLSDGYSVEFRKVRDCLLDPEDGTWPGHMDGVESASDLYYVAIVKMPHGPFSFYRRVKL